MKTPLQHTVLCHGLRLLLLACALRALPGAGQTPQFMTYQGYLTDQNGTALATNGPQAYDVVFRIWSQPTGGAKPLYGELQTVTVVNGYFSVLLGQGNSYVNGGVTDPRPPLSTVFTTNYSVSAARYVEMTVKGLASGADVTILPRLQLVSAPYSFMAANAVSLVSATTGNTLISSAGTNVIINGSIAANSVNGNLTDLGGSIYMDNSQLILAKNSAGTYENCFYPRWSDNVTYLNYGSGGFNIRNDSSTSTMWMSPNGNVGIGTTDPISALGYPAGWNGFHAYSGGGNNGLGIIEGSVSARLHLRNDSGELNFAQDFVLDDSDNEVNFRWLGGSLGNRVNIMTLDQNGRVGIGTTGPQRLLTVNGSGANPGADATYQAGFGAGASQLILGYDTADDVGVIAASDYQTAWKNVVLTPSGGNVGIGTLSPQAVLHVDTGGFPTAILDGSSTLGTWTDFRNSSTGGTNWLVISTGIGNGGGPGHLQFSAGPFPNETANPVMDLTPSGLVGFGTVTPSVAQVEIRNFGVATSTSDYGYLNTGGAGHEPSGSGSFYCSIYADSRILAPEVDAFSDARIKTIEGVSDSARDLHTLLGMQITDYRMVDKVANGDRPLKKVIGQQIESVYPQAVSRSTNVVPDIYVKTEATGGWIHLAKNLDPALKVGDRVRLITGKENILQEVTEVKADGFRVKAPLNGPVFVYGREVNDFRTVDYDAIAMLNVSATQELAKRLERLEARESHLADLEQKAAQVATLEAEVADLKRTVTQLAAESKHARLAADATPPGRAAGADGMVSTPITTASVDR